MPRTLRLKVVVNEDKLSILEDFCAKHRMSLDTLASRIIENLFSNRDHKYYLRAVKTSPRVSATVHQLRLKKKSVELKLVHHDDRIESAAISSAELKLVVSEQSSDQALTPSASARGEVAVPGQTSSEQLQKLLMAAFERSAEGSAKPVGCSPYLDKLRARRKGLQRLTHMVANPGLFLDVECAELERYLGVRPEGIPALAEAYRSRSRAYVQWKDYRQSLLEELAQVNNGSDRIKREIRRQISEFEVTTRWYEREF